MGQEVKVFTLQARTLPLPTVAPALSRAGMNSPVHPSQGIGHAEHIRRVGHGAGISSGTGSKTGILDVRPSHAMGLEVVVHAPRTIRSTNKIPNDRYSSHLILDAVAVGPRESRRTRASSTSILIVPIPCVLESVPWVFIVPRRAIVHHLTSPSRFRNR